MTVSKGITEPRSIDAALAAANVMMRVAARSVVEVEDVVTTPQLRVLMLIAASSPQSLSAVAAELDVHPSNATRTVDKLVQAGLIVRSDAPVDRRFVHLQLTSEGSALVEHVLDSRRRAMADVFAAMPEADRARVASAFELFAEAAGGEPIRDGRFAFDLRSLS
jgi:DNA-binding MarR family transcriptional regulator